MRERFPSGLKIDRFSTSWPSSASVMADMLEGATAQEMLQQASKSNNRRRGGAMSAEQQQQLREATALVNAAGPPPSGRSFKKAPPFKREEDSSKGAGAAAGGLMYVRSNHDIIAMIMMGVSFPSSCFFELVVEGETLFF